MITGIEVLYKNEKYWVTFIEYQVENQPNIWIGKYDPYKIGTPKQLVDAAFKVFSEDLEILTKEKNPEYFL